MTGLWRSLMDAASGWNTLAIFLRLVLAMLSGMAVGIDRGLKRRGAGVKTHVLVCLGSALVMMTSEYMVYAFPGEKLDLARLGAQVISGIGFLGDRKKPDTGSHHRSGTVDQRLCGTGHRHRLCGGGHLHPDLHDAHIKGADPGRCPAPPLCQSL